MTDEEKRDAPEQETAPEATEEPAQPEATEEKPAEEKKEDAPAETPTEPAEETPAEPPAAATQEEITGREEQTEEEPEVAPEDVEEIPHQNIRPGMVVRVHEKIKDISPKGQERERVQVFEGLVLGVKGSGVSRTMTVRKDSKGWMVEKIFPLSSPNLDKIEVIKQYKVRRAKLSYLRGRFKRKLREVKKEN